MSYFCVVSSGMPADAVKKLDRAAKALASSRSRVVRDLIEALSTEEIIEIIKRKEGSNNAKD